MTVPIGTDIIDTLIHFPHRDMKEAYKFITTQTRDKESKEDFEFPVEYMFKDVPDKELGKQLRDADDPVAITLAEMDRWGITRGLISIGGKDSDSDRALRDHPDRFIASLNVDGNDGMDGIRRIKRVNERYDLRALTCFPAGSNPPVPINDKKMYPIYAACVELGLPIFCCAGVPGPRVPFAA